MGAEDAEPKSDQTGQHPLYRRMENKRGHPRVRLRMPVQIGLRGGQVVCARIYNMSPDGIQIRCEPSAARAINPPGCEVAPGDGPPVLVAMRLDTGLDVQTVVVRARLSYALPESPDEVIMGLSFEEMGRGQRSAIESALSASLVARDS